MSARLKFTEPDPEPVLFKLDLGCGKGHKTPEGFEKIDLHPSKGVTVVDLRKKWPWKSNSVDEAHADYLLHLFTMPDRIHFANELYRVLKPGAKCVVIVPHEFAARAYGDPGAQWPPVTEAWFPWLSKRWRESLNLVDASGLTCDFDHGLGYGMHPALISRNQEYQQNALTWYKEAAQDLVVTLTKI